MENEKPEGYVFGRPTKYKPEYCEKMLLFFRGEPYRIEKIEVETAGTTEKTGDIQKTVTKFEYRGNKLPTFERFASEIGVIHQTLHNWCETYPDFLEAYALCKEIQKDFIIQNGLLGFYNPGFAKFVAINCTDLKDNPDDNSDLDNEETEYDSSAFKKEKE